jgi:ribosomal protein S18 acetylase RimI-like enzyme
MKIRPATQEDVPAISELVASLSHYYLDDPSASLPAWFASTLTDSAFASRLASTDFLNYVYVQSNTVVGYVSVKGRSHLYHLFVAKSQQGQGIARQLWRHALGFCRGNVTVRSSIYAVPVYQRFGFAVAGPAGTKEGIAFQPMELARV